MQVIYHADGKCMGGFNVLFKVLDQKIDLRARVVAHMRTLEYTA